MSNTNRPILHRGAPTKRRRALRLAAFLSLGALVVGAAWAGGAPASAAPKAKTDATEVIHWNEVALSTLLAIPGPNGGAPSALPINLGMVQGAVYDAVNAIGPAKYRPYLLKKRFGAKASVNAAVATAAYDVLTNLVSTAPELAPFPGRAGLLATLDTTYAASLAAVPDGSSKQQGVEAGHAAAKAMLKARAADGRFGPSQWDPNPDPGHWQPLLNAQGQQILDPTPWVGAVTPFLVKNPSTFRIQPPLELDSDAYATEFNQVKTLGRATGSTRTDDQTYIAKWWQSQPTASWNEVARHLIPLKHLDARAAARLLALQNLSGADAAIGCWKNKYYYDFWRPWNAVVRAGEDNNDATEADPGWTALITAPYPEWPSGHNCLDGAHVAILRSYFGDIPSGGFQITSLSALLTPTEQKVRTFATFSQPMAELLDARVWAGLHFFSADVEGQRLGANVAAYATAKYLRPVGKH